ncbi:MULTISPECIES: cupin domain-containing protein [unclassified Plantactinospora]|uniref:cupin domain-containing protein n=1 Tax=unclassified Plantactinospora TaxID=2631981 RepID=UPI001F261359|nr:MULTISPECIES: cupin domain-containing protein [unclassified Plantactinospora]
MIRGADVVVVTESESRTTRTPGGTMSGLATPSQGSAELATWRVRMAPDGAGPVHAVDREQVWMPLAGSFTVTVDGQTRVIGAGQAAILPAGVARQIRAGAEPAEALVCMPAGGTATVPDDPQPRELPWAR